MATYSFPALGFDPAPGDPDAIDAVARECRRCAQGLSADAEQLRQLSLEVDWQGAAGEAFAAHPTQLHDDLSLASDAHGGIGSALASYAAAVRRGQVDAQRLEREAAEARARADRHAGEVDRLAASISVAPPGAEVTDMAGQQGIARRLQGHAEDDFQLAVTRARAVEIMQREAGDHAAARIRALSEAPYHEPGVLSRMAHGVANWVAMHAGTLREISNVLKTASAIAGLLSFVPALTPIFAPIATLTAGGALVIDAALVATGNNDCKVLLVDVALMVVPAAGRLVSRSVAARALNPLTSGRVPRASTVARWAERQGWRPSQTSTGPLKYLDDQGIARVTIKKGSARTPGSEQPHVELRDSAGRRIDRYGKPVLRRSPENHTPITWDL